MFLRSGLILCLFAVWSLLLLVGNANADVLSAYDLQPGRVYVSNTTGSGSGAPQNHISPSNTYLITALYSTWQQTITCNTLNDFYNTLALCNRFSVGGNEVLSFNSFAGTLPTTWPSSVTFIVNVWRCTPYEEVVSSGKNPIDPSSSITNDNLHVIQSRMSSAVARLDSIQSAVASGNNAVMSNNSTSTVQNGKVVDSVKDSTDTVGKAAKMVAGFLLASVVAFTWKG